MIDQRQLQSLLDYPQEDLNREYKGWLNIEDIEDKAKLVKAAIALANHGGGFIIIGMDEDASGVPKSKECPPDMPSFTQDLVNGAIKRFAEPAFHCAVDFRQDQQTGHKHPIIRVPGGMTVPIMSKRKYSIVLKQHCCYIRKPGPKSEEPQTAEEWRALLQNCVRENRQELLDAIRSIVTGKASTDTPPDEEAKLEQFCKDAKEHWQELVKDYPKDDPRRHPNGSYEMGFSLVGAKPAANLTELKNRIEQAGKTILTGAPPFSTEKHSSRYGAHSKPYMHDQYIESLVKYKTDFGCHDFWRSSIEGNLYTISGYSEDLNRGCSKNTWSYGDNFLHENFIWRAGERVLFAKRFADTFENVENIVIYLYYTGLKDRCIIDAKHYYIHASGSHTDTFGQTKQFPLQQIEANLAEITYELLYPLYEKFNFYQLEKSLVDHELEKMRKNRF